MNLPTDQDVGTELWTTTALLNRRLSRPEDRLLSILTISAPRLTAENAWIGGPVPRNTRIPCWSDLIGSGAQILWVETMKGGTDPVGIDDFQMPDCEVRRRQYRALSPGSVALPRGAAWLCAVSMDVVSECEEEFNAWYSEEHVPRIAKVPGVVSAHRFIASDGFSRYLALYFVEGPSTLMSPDYAYATETPWTYRVRRSMRGVIRYVYRHSSLLEPRRETYE